MSTTSGAKSDVYSEYCVVCSVPVCMPLYTGTRRREVAGNADRYKLVTVQSCRTFQVHGILPSSSSLLLITMTTAANERQFRGTHGCIGDSTLEQGNNFRALTYDLVAVSVESPPIDDHCTEESKDLKPICQDDTEVEAAPMKQDPDSIPFLIESLNISISSKLYERESQQEQLLQAYRRLKDRNEPEFILISGPCGSGKTHLVKTLSNAISNDGGILLTGKFDQLRKPEPYKAFIAIFTEFASLIMEDNDKRAATRNAILEAVGDGAGVLTDMIPALGRVIGHQDRTSTVNKDKAICSFVFVFQMFVKAICSPEHPLVFVLEDMQWADTCSLELWTSLLTDMDSKGAVFIGTCEENISSDSPVSTMLRKLEDTSNVTITNIQVGNFTKDELHEILLNELRLPLDEISELADEVFWHTQGNLFYLTEFIRWLEETEVLEYDQDLMRWTYDHQEISLTSKCGGAGEFLVNKIKQLPASTQEVLKVASCLGSVIDEELLRIILNFDVSHALKAAMKQGLLVTDHHQNFYVFAHDVTQKAAYSMIPQANQSAFHLTIGRKMRQRSENRILENDIFTLVSQFCLSGDLIKGYEEKEAVASLCLYASRKAVKCSTFRTASAYLNFGIELLGSACWREHYALSLQLYNGAAEMALCTADFKRMDHLLNTAFENIQIFQDKLQAYATRIYSLGVRDQQQQAISEGKEVLKHLGETFPERLCKPRLLREMASVQRLLRGKSDAMLLRLPQMDDPFKLATIRILDLIFLSSLVSRPSFAPFVVLKLMKVTLQDGFSPWTANSFATYGMLCCTIGKVDEAFRFGQLSLQLLERSRRREFLPRIYAVVYGTIIAKALNCKTYFKSLTLSMLQKYVSSKDAFTAGKDLLLKPSSLCSLHVALG